MSVRVTGLALIVATLLLGILLAMVGVSYLDRSIMAGLATGRENTALFWQWVTWLGDREVRIGVGLALAAALLARRGWQDAVLLLGTVAIETAVNSGLKLVFERARPDLLAHLDVVTSLSYPSGHAAHSATLYGLGLALIFAPDRMRISALVIAAAIVFLIGVSRIVLGVHWPSDVVGGWASGAGFALLAWSLRDRIYQRYPQSRRS